MTCPEWCAEGTAHPGRCRSTHRMVRTATLRLMTICGQQVERGSVEQWDQRTSGNDARAALSIAQGADPNDVCPIYGTWSEVK